MTDSEVRFWAKVDKRGPDECWPWVGARTNKGYGQVRRGGAMYRAHRLAYLFTHGGIAPRAEGTSDHVLHKCDNPPCCNPRHLFVGTHVENMLDRERKGRTPIPAHGAAHVNARLTNKQVRAMRRRWATGIETTYDLAAAFNVSQFAAWRAVTHRSYKEAA